MSGPNGSDLTAARQNASARILFPTGSVNPVTGFFMVVQMLASLPLDSLMIYSILASTELRKNAANLIVVSHALAEMLLVSSWGLFNGYYILIDQNEMVCKLASFATAISYDAMVSSIVLLSIERYMAMYHTHNLHHFFTTRKTLALVAVLWSIMALICLPALDIDGSFESSYGVWHLCYPADKHFSSWLSIYLIIKDMVVVYGTSYAITAYCNLKIFKRLGKHQAQMEHAAVGSNISAESFRSIQKLLLWYCLMPWLSGPSIIYGYALPDGIDLPWVARAVTIFAYMQFVSCFAVITWLKPVRREVCANIKRVQLRLKRLRAITCCRPEADIGIVVPDVIPQRREIRQNGSPGASDANCKRGKTTITPLVSFSKQVSPSASLACPRGEASSCI